MTSEPCVWVSAGVLRYRLCDRRFECERCPLHLALTGGGTDAALDDGAARELGRLEAGCALHLDRGYNRHGLWVAPAAGGRVRIGLDDFTLRLIEPLDDIVLPRPGVHLGHGAPCAWLHRGPLQLSLASPVAGDVVAAQSCPKLSLSDAAEPDENRWWLELVPGEPLEMTDGLYRNEALLRWFQGRMRTVHEQLTDVLTPVGAAPGPALADGGMPTRDLAIVLGKARFESLVGTLFPP